MPRSPAERFWDERAREHALFYVDNRLDYAEPDEAAFWAGGEEAVHGLLAIAGARLEPADTTVDVGCGVGRLTRVLARESRHVYAVDVSAEMLARAARLNPGLENVTWVHGDGRSLAGVPSGAADACLSHVVFQHIPDPGVTLGYVREMGRVLRPGGWAAFQVSTDPAVHRRRRLARRRTEDHPAWLGSAVAIEDLERAAADGGLALERVVAAGTQFTTVLARRG